MSTRLPSRLVLHGATLVVLAAFAGGVVAPDAHAITRHIYYETASYQHHDRCNLDLGPSPDPSCYLP